MHQSMVMTTKLYQVSKTGLTTFAPVLDMVPVDIVFECATRELAAFISCFQGSYSACFMRVGRVTRSFLFPVPTILKVRGCILKRTHRFLRGCFVGSGLTGLSILSL